MTTPNEHSPTTTGAGQNNSNGTGHGSNAYTLAALGIADLRTSVATELSRIKEDIGELHEKINAVKDGISTDKIALITQLNQEFTALNRRMSDFSLALQGIMSDASHSGELLTTKLSSITNDFEHKLEAFRNDISRVFPESRLIELDHAVTDLREVVEKMEGAFKQFTDKHDTVDEEASEELMGEVKRYVRKQIGNAKTERDAELTALRTEVVTLKEKDAKHTAKLAALDKRVTRLAAKVTAGVAALAWILNALFGDNAKSMVGKLVSPQTQTVIEAASKSKQTAVDGTGTVKDSASQQTPQTPAKPAGGPR